MNNKQAVFSLIVTVTWVVFVSAADSRGCDLVCGDGEVINLTLCKCVPEPTVILKSDCALLNCVSETPMCLSYKYDENGCRTCECTFRCPVRECFNCLYGIEYFFDQFGCNSCRCKQPQSCGNSTCTVYCAEGYIQDIYGCDTCKCKHCGSVCKIGCEFEKLKDFDGCELCECNPKPECRPVCFNETCEHGRVFDKQGCPTCQCVSKSPCGPSCDIICKYGIQYDKYGCSTCQCLENPYCRPHCNNQCPNGRLYDIIGCPTCTCHPHSSP